MEVSVFGWDGEKLTKQDWGLFDTEGWWNRLTFSDIDGDGDLDLMVGNRGLNGVLRTSSENPVLLHAQDIDQNGSIDPIISYVAEGKRKPFADRDALAHQLPKLKKRFLSYKKFSGATLAEVFPELGVADAEVKTFASCWFEQKDGRFIMHELPMEAQLAPLFAIAQVDSVTWLVGGGLKGVNPAYGRYLSGGGTMLRWAGSDFVAVPAYESGFWMPGELRHILPIKTNVNQAPTWLGVFSNGAVLGWKQQ
jgi:hypothetical protein